MLPQASFYWHRVCMTKSNVTQYNCTLSSSIQVISGPGNPYKLCRPLSPVSLSKQNSVKKLKFTFEKPINIYSNVLSSTEGKAATYLVFKQILTSNQANFIRCSSGKRNFGQNSRIVGLHFCLNTKLRIQPAMLVNCLKIIILMIEMSSMHENCDCFNFDDVTLTLISALYSLILLPNSFIFHTWRKNRKNNDFWAVGRCSNVVC